MIVWASAFLVIALVAATVGFTGAAGSMTWLAQFIFSLGMIFFVTSMLFGKPPPP